MHKSVYSSRAGNNYDHLWHMWCCG